MMLAHLATILLAQAPGAQIDAQLAALEARIEVLEGQPSTPAGVYRVDEWIVPGGDLAEAIDAIQRDPGCEGLGTRAQGGCRILIPRGIYETSTIHLCRMVVLEGVTGRGGGAATEIRTDGVTGIHVAGARYCTDVLGFAEGAHGGWSRISDLRLLDTAGVWTETSSAVVYAAGVHLEARAALRDLWISGYTQGIRITADVRRTDTQYDPSFSWVRDAATNANIWSIQDVLVTSSRHSGVYVDGADANAGYAIGLDAASNCVDGDVLELEPCANIHDSSFLGNTYVAPHSATSRDRRGGIHHQFLTDSINGRNVWLGAYAEQGNGVSIASRNDIVLGGLSAWSAESDGLRLQGTFVSGFCTYDDRERLFDEQLCVGRLGGSGVLAASADAGTLRLKPSSYLGVAAWLWDVSNLASARSLYVIAESAGGMEPGDVIVTGALVAP